MWQNLDKKKKKDEKMKKKQIKNWKKNKERKGKQIEKDGGKSINREIHGVRRKAKKVQVHLYLNQYT